MMILKLGKRFLCFFDMSLQKNVKSHVFLDFQKNEKNVLSNYADVIIKGQNPLHEFPRCKSAINWQQVGSFPVYGEVTGKHNTCRLRLNAFRA